MAIRHGMVSATAFYGNHEITLSFLNQAAYERFRDTTTDVLRSGGGWVTYWTPQDRKEKYQFLISAGVPLRLRMD